MAVDREALVRSAEKYVQRGKIDAAIKEYRKVLAENPTDANTLNRVGDLYARLEKFDEAVRFFTQIAEQYTKDGFFVKAIAIYKKIIKLDPTSLAVYERLAELYWRQGLVNEARTQYQVLADYYTRHSNATSAITIYQKMAEVEPENPSYRLKLAELFQSQRLFEKALREYRALADLFVVAGQVDEAVQVYSKAFELVGESLDFVREAVSGLNESGHEAAAARLLARASELNPRASALAQQIGLRLPGSPEEKAAAQKPESTEQEAQAVTAFEAPSFEDTPSFEEAPSFEAATGFEAAPSFEASGSFDSPSFDSPGFESPSSYPSYGTATSFGGFSEEPAAAPPLEEPGTGMGGFGQDAMPLEDEFSFDLENDDEPESLVKPPPGLHTSRAGEDAEVDVGEFAFEIDLDEEGESSPYAANARQETAKAIDPVEIEWSMDPMADLDINLPPPDDEPVVATDLRKMARSAPPSPPAPPAEDHFEIDIDLEETAPLNLVSAESPKFAAQEPFSLSLDDDEDEDDDQDVYSIDLDAASSFEDVEIEVDLESTAATSLAKPAPATSSPTTPSPAASPKVATQPRPAIPPLLPEVEEEDDEEDDLAAVRREEDLLAEARVFAKYGLKEKALDRLKDLLRVSPYHLDGLILMTRFDLDAGRHEDARRNANEVSRLSLEAGDNERWTELRNDMGAAGFGFEGENVSFLPGEARPASKSSVARPAEARPSGKPASDDRIAQLLEDLSLESFESAPSREREERASYQSLLQETLPEAAPVPVPPPPAEKAKTSLVSLVDELGLDDLDDDEEEVAMPIRRPVAHAPAAPRAADPLDETGMSWLDDVAPAPQKPTAQAPSASETIFDEEDDFFDLAAELEAELDAVDINDSMITSLQPQEQSLEEIIEGFKQGVADNLSTEDYDTHFNLGIAYREMGLLDEAIGEFQLSSKDSRYLVESSSMLGICFMEKGLPELAVRWYRRGLESPKISEEVTLGLLYDMGIAYMTLADYDAAYKTFVEIYGMNSNFRDVSSKLQELAPLRQS